MTKHRVRYCKISVWDKCLHHGTKTVTTRRFDTASSTYAAAFATIAAEGKNPTLDAVKLHSEERTTLAAAQGTVALLSNSDIDYEQKKRREEGALWWNDSDQEHVRETVEHVEITVDGGLAINAGKGIVIAYHKSGDLQASREQLAESPGLEWLGALKNDPRVNWTPPRTYEFMR